MKISILLDNPNSWIVPYAKELEAELSRRGHVVAFVHRADDLVEGDCAFFLSCERIVPPRLLARNKFNLVVHESDLPKGKGWSPLTWQIIEGKNEIPVTLFEAVEGVDSGCLYDQEVLHFEGHECVDELREAQGRATIRLALRFVEKYPAVSGKPQEGEETFYPKRTPKDSELDGTKPLFELFNQLRVADNERYPAFFKHKGHTYILKIYKKE